MQLRYRFTVWRTVDSNHFMDSEDEQEIRAQQSDLNASVNIWAFAGPSFSKISSF